jgi:hypothetical protein
VLSFLTAGCTWEDGQIEAEDESTWFPTGKASFDVDGRGPVRYTNGPAAYSMTVDYSIDVEVSANEGESSDHIAAGDQVRFEDINIVGPRDLAIDYDLFLSSVVFAATFRSERGLLLRGFAGVAYSDLDLDIDAGLQEDSASIQGIGPTVGGRVGWYPRQTYGMYAQLSHRFSFPEEFDVVSIFQFDAGLEILATKSFALFGGWRWIAYEGYDYDDDWDGHDHDDELALDLELSGPMVGITLSF